MEEQKRATGQSTRLMDAYIQQLFRNGSVEIRDHVDNKDCHHLLANKIAHRLHEEHIGIEVRASRTSGGGILMEIVSQPDYSKAI